MKRPVEIKHYMLLHPVTVHPETRIIDAAKKIVEHKLSGLCVVDHDHNLVGMLSELDCLRAMMDRVLERGEKDAGTVGEVMATDVEASDPGDQIINVASSMLEHGRRRRPVVRGTRLEGMVSCRQILKAIKDFAVPMDQKESN